MSFWSGLGLGMNNDQRESADVRAALAAELEAETLKLVADASGYGPVEAVMRVRALAEIAEALSTEALLRLALQVQEGPRKGGGEGVRSYL